MCVYCYHVIINYSYKVSDSRKKNSKVSDVQAFYWLSKYLVYYLCMNECDCLNQ